MSFWLYNSIVLCNSKLLRFIRVWYSIRTYCTYKEEERKREIINASKEQRESYIYLVLSTFVGLLKFFLCLFFFSTIALRRRRKFEEMRDDRSLCHDKFWKKRKEKKKKWVKPLYVPRKCSRSRPSDCIILHHTHCCCVTRTSIIIYKTRVKRYANSQ